MLSELKVFYRLSPLNVAAQKAKLPAANKQACLLNAVNTFGANRITVWGDSLPADLVEFVKHLNVDCVLLSVASGAESFRQAASAAMDSDANTPVYLLEDDYLHRPESPQLIVEGLSLGAQYVTLYDHPDKYLSPSQGGNPSVTNGGERTILMCGTSCHWKDTNSTTMTFATTAKQLRLDWRFFSRHCSAKYMDDFKIFKGLRRSGRRLISSVPGYSTHIETRWLSPHFNWSSLLTSTGTASKT